MFYLVKTPWWLKKLYSQFIWDFYGSGNNIYLTFDDGPHPEITPFVLDELKKYNAKAGFFCIGKNVIEHPGVYRRILDEGHIAGNHTQHHLNGFKTDDQTYLEDIGAASTHIESNFFRPPYGRIRRSQYRKLKSAMPGMKVIMWDVLSGDFDPGISEKQCLENVIKKARSGTVIVFHDSEKAYAKLRYALPLVLKYFSEKGFAFKAIR
jgi:peptidoglycan/xylan/chitin deacetylase (PgdA/CDA1 family)